MTTLTGSDKQIAWATDIRANAITRHETVIRDLTAILAGELAADWFTGSPSQSLMIEFMIDRYTSRLAEIQDETSAAFFIDNRTSAPFMWSEYLAKPGLAAQLVMSDETKMYDLAIRIVADPEANGATPELIERLRTNKNMPGAAIVFDWADRRSA